MLMQTLDYCICGRLQAEVSYIRIKLNKMEYSLLTIRFSNYSEENLPCLSKHGSCSASCARPTLKGHRVKSVQICLASAVLFVEVDKWPSCWTVFFLYLPPGARLTPASKKAGCPRQRVTVSPVLALPPGDALRRVLAAFSIPPLVWWDCSHSSWSSTMS